MLFAMIYLILGSWNYRICPPSAYKKWSQSRTNVLQGLRVIILLSVFEGPLHGLLLAMTYLTLESWNYRIWLPRVDKKWSQSRTNGSQGLRVVTLLCVFEAPLQRDVICSDLSHSGKLEL